MKRVGFNLASNFVFFRAYHSARPAGHYSELMNTLNYHKLKLRNSFNSLNAAARQQQREQVQKHLDVSSTYHSLALTADYGLSLKDASVLLLDRKTLASKKWTDQAFTMNHFNMVGYCRQYISILPPVNQTNSGEDQSEEAIVGLRCIEDTFTNMFFASVPGLIDVVDGSYYPAGALYFFDHLPVHEHLDNAKRLLIDCVKRKQADPVMVAARMHGEFAKAHRFDEQFGLLFSRLYMNFSLMLNDYAPAIIELDKREEYLELVNRQMKNDDPQPLAEFLVRRLIDVYEKQVPQFHEMKRNEEQSTPTPSLG